MSSSRTAQTNVKPGPGRRSQPASDHEPTLSIGELAALSGVSTRTIRYYEELGILPRPSRTEGGTRRYTRDYVFFVEGALVLKQLGFGLDEIAELGEFALRGHKATGRTRDILQAKLADLEHRIRVLERLQDIIRTAATSPSGRANVDVPELLRWVGEMNSHDDKQPIFTHT